MSTVIQNLLYAFVGGCIIRAVLLIIYRIYFHPLSRFPGPLLAKVTDLWSVYHNLRGQSHLIALEWHKAHGTIIRFGPNKLSLSSISAIREVYNSKSILKSEVFATICPSPGAFSTFTSIDPEMHRRKRKVFSQAFSDRAIAEFESTILQHVDIFVQQIVREIPVSGTGTVTWSLPLNMTPRARFYATDVMGNFGFGKSFDMQTSDENKFLIKATDGATIIAGMYTQYPKLYHWGMGRLVAIAGMSTKERFGRLAQNLIERRLREDDASKRDLLHFMSAAKHDPETSSYFSMNEVWAESRFILIAGAETTATAISACLFYLSRYPETYRKLTNVLRRTFDKDDEICSGPQLAGCHYLWACVDEAMRLSPSVVAILWRQVTYDDIMIDDIVIPKGSDLGFSSYVPHHDDQIFERPFAYMPERWLDVDGDSAEDSSVRKERIQVQRQAFNPFGLGVRKCIGMRMAYGEIALCLARTLWGLDMRVPEEEQVARIGGGQTESPNRLRRREDEFQLYEHITTRHDGPYLEWSIRKDA